MGNLVQLENFAKLQPFIGMFGNGLAVTVLMALITVVIGFMLAVILAMMRMSNLCPFRFLQTDKNGHLRDGGFLLWLGRFNPLGFLATAYVEVLRSTPVIVQVFIIYYGIGPLLNLPRYNLFGFIPIERFIPGIIALGMNSGAYLCEILRSGIQSIDGGQTEAARSLGLKQSQNFRYIIFPQALKNILPAIANEFVVIIKESAVTYIIGVRDLMSIVQTVRGSIAIIMEPLLVATAIYFCLCFPTSKIIAYFERRMSRGDKR